ncbi:hypothetical protein MHI37_04605 [Paenibacillus sp. FSL H8-0548]|uniref:transposase n=1 Tax=Paenibacillus sp. FSL H8-0548 TaxID=1920422 RepID=UPI00117D8CD0|nr:transposase [Paenibacillus sp. FSL H8-0548]
MKKYLLCDIDKQCSIYSSSLQRIRKQAAWYFQVFAIGTHDESSQDGKRHEEGILRWFHRRMTNGLLEGVNFTYPVERKTFFFMFAMTSILTSNGCPFLFLESATSARFLSVPRSRLPFLVGAWM